MYVFSMMLTAVPYLTIYNSVVNQSSDVNYKEQK